MFDSNDGQANFADAPKLPLINQLSKAPEQLLSSSVAGKSPEKYDLINLPALAISSAVKGFLEPAAGALQITEQLANAATSNIPGIQKSYFEPEKLSPEQGEKAPKYSAAWFVENISENVGKLPWYLLAAKGLGKVPGLQAEVGVLSERSILGMNVKTAASSGFVLGALSPTALQQNGSLLDSLKERSLQGSIAAGQMALMTLGVAGLSKGVATTENYLAAALSPAARLESMSSAAALTVLKNASIAGVGAIPSGLAAGYINAKVHGTDFDPTESVVSTVTIGFGLGLFGGGAKSKESPDLTIIEKQNAAPSAAAIENQALEKTATAAVGDVGGTPPIVRRETLPGNRVIEYHNYEDGTVVEHHMPGSIPELGNVIRTLLTDGTIIQKNRDWTFTEKPDGSTIYSDSYRTSYMDKNHTGIEVPTPQAESLRDWHKLSQTQKLDTLSSLDAVPHGGNLIGEIVEKALFGDRDQVVRDAALPNIKKINGPSQQSEAWHYAWGNFPEYRSSLLSMIPELQAGAQQNIMLDRGASFVSGSTSSGIRSHLSDMLSALDEHKQTQGLAGDTTGDGTGQDTSSLKAGGTPALPGGKQSSIDEYLQMVQSMPEPVRQKIFNSLDSLLRDPELAQQDPLGPLATRIRHGLETNDPVVSSAFGQFWQKELVNPYTRLAPGLVARDGLPNLELTAAGELGSKLDQFKTIFKSQGDWETQTQRFLDQNPGLELQKEIYDWAINQPERSVQRVVDSSLSFDRLQQIYRNLTKDAPLKSSDQHENDNAPARLMQRARQEGISTTQVRETMQNVVQLLEIANRFPGLSAANDFRMAGIQALRQAADPLIITQGNHPTCALASLETYMYKNNPAEATRLVNEVLRSGKFITTDGTEIKIDALTLKPAERSLAANKTKFHDPREVEGYRSYASQVFQNTVANIYWQRQRQTPYLPSLRGSLTVPMGSMRYEMRETTDHSGISELQDQLVYYEKGHRYVLKESPYIITLHELEDMGRQIGGDSTVPTIIPDPSPVLASKAAFEAYLKTLTPKNFPLITSVDANAMMNPSKPDIHLNHAISILLNPDGKAYMHNTWQPFSDVHAPGKWIPNSFSLQRLMEIMGVQ